MPKGPENTQEFSSLVEVVRILRSPEGCPWDREQTHKSLTPFTLEEAHELVEAIDKGEDKEICEELGDVLLQVVLNAQVAKDRQAFDINDVIKSITDKMIRRHEHVFGDVKLNNSKEVTGHWDKLKEKENPAYKNPFANIPANMPALLRSQKIGNKTIRFNFDWENVEQVFEKVDEELQELKDAWKAKDKKEVEIELGDLLFSVAQLSRHLELDAETSLRKANKKFEHRFQEMAKIIEADSKKMQELGLVELEEYWSKAKHQIKANNGSL